MNNVNYLNVMKIHQKCHMLNCKSSDALCLLTLLTYAMVEANSANPDQQPFILFLHCST